MSKSTKNYGNLNQNVLFVDGNVDLIEEKIVIKIN